VKSLRRSASRQGDRIYIIGLGVMGQLHALVAQHLGALVYASDFIEQRRSLAQRNGAIAFHPNEAPEPLDRGADVVICGPATPEAMNHAFETVAPAGTVVVFTPFAPGVEFTVPPERFYFSDLRLVASYSCGPDDTRAALELIANGVVTAEKIGATPIAIDDVPRAYREFARTKLIKPIVRFDHPSA
jgi:L-iditol 2-dehydrogenase